MARAAPIAAVFRKGPTRWVQVLLWHTDRDEFQEGQWFHGRIYERRCDLSPSGKFLVYFANKITGRTIRDTEYTYAWTAVSKPPYLTALALWPKGDTWHGGGLFESETHLWLNHGPHAATAHSDHRPPRWLRVTPNPMAQGEDWPVWSRRMTRDGWSMVQKGSFHLEGLSAWRTEQTEIWERLSPDASARLRLTTVGINFRMPGGPYVVRFALHLPSGAVIPVEDARWADWDQAGRLVYAREGRLFRGEIHDGRIVESVLGDLNPNKPYTFRAPDHARRWR